MGAIGGEELTKWEKMQGAASASEEKILVFVRLRPLGQKEIAKNEVSDWECINETTILFRNSLQERSMFPTAYTFDRVYGGDSLTKQIYEDGVKEIALSVVSGINSSIFAYGQTSSGKTYTMIGITENAVADIYDYIQRHEERAFVLKFSAIEIYNEAVRDLLSSDSFPLRLLDDPEKGTIVERLTEVTLRDWSHLKDLLSICEAQRQVGETTLNETSSRSHQILRLTIESSAREFLGKENSTTLAASVNFVDLAGSERASQALSVGTRLKEGCHINRSLLTLGTVIRKLSKGKHGHVNYRDSKLTRILQPSLGGNARTAIICTLSPARSHVEQSRNTLLFACCAKEVTTNAQVNVVMSDKALVKHLQRELARLESELRTPAPISNFDYAALLRKKDLQIEKLEKEVRELTKQRDLAQSRVEDLLRGDGSDQSSRPWEGGVHPKWQKGGWEDDGSLSESSCVADPRSLDLGVRKVNNTRTSNRNYGHSSQVHPHFNMSDGASSQQSESSKYTKPGPYKGQKEFSVRTGEDPDDTCKEVRCIEMDESSKERSGESIASPLPISENERLWTLRASREDNGADEEIVPTLPRGVTRNQNGSSIRALEQKFQDLQKTIDCLASPYHQEPSDRDWEADTSASRSFQLSRSWSCKENLMTGSSSPCFDYIQNTPPNVLDKSFPGRPERFSKMLPPLSFSSSNANLSRNDSQSSIGSAFVDGHKAQDSKGSPNEDIPSIHTFVAGMKEMAKLQYEKQLGNGQELGPNAEKFGKNVKNVGLDPMQHSMESPNNWPLEFMRQQKMILELWRTCNVSLVHRTYFFLLFKGEPADSIYMEVELRRLSFLKESLSQGNQAIEDGRTLTLTSSMKALRREREMLSRLMNRRLSYEERNRVYEKWGISLDSKRRRLQLVGQLWSNEEDMNHVKDSAAIVAKLIGFSEQGQALKEMFGLSFTPPRVNRRSFGWKHSMSSLL